jgi:hypothetical protein
LISKPLFFSSTSKGTRVAESALYYGTDMTWVSFFGGIAGGACGYGVLSTSPYGSSIAAGNSPLFLNGSGCGVCYEVKCNHTDLCKPTATDVVITDLCPGGAFCDGSFPHFDLSGTAISNMAISGQEEALRTVAVYDLLYRR